jgi:hypothetical protein
MSGHEQVSALRRYREGLTRSYPLDDRRRRAVARATAPALCAPPGSHYKQPIQHIPRALPRLSFTQSPRTGQIDGVVGCVGSYHREFVQLALCYGLIPVRRRSRNGVFPGASWNFAVLDEAP